MFFPDFIPGFLGTHSNEGVWTGKSIGKVECGRGILDGGLVT